MFLYTWSPPFNRITLIISWNLTGFKYKYNKYKLNNTHTSNQFICNSMLCSLLHELRFLFLEQYLMLQANIISIHLLFVQLQVNYFIELSLWHMQVIPSSTRGKLIPIFIWDLFKHLLMKSVFDDLACMFAHKMGCQSL